MKIEHISISRHGTWHECHQKYKYRYHLGMKSPVESPFYFEYGKIVHKIAEEYVKNRGDQALNEVARHVLDGKVEIEEGVRASTLPLDYRNRLPEHLRAIESLTKKVGFEGELEYPFELDIDPPNKKMLSGVIDRLIFKNDKFFIIDYKTTKRGKFRKDPYTIRHDIQLRAYTWAVQQIFKIDVDKIRSALYYLEGANLVAAKFSQRSIDAAIKELVEVYDEIQKADPNKVNGSPGFWCSRCDYRDICPYSRRN